MLPVRFSGDLLFLKRLSKMIQRSCIIMEMIFRDSFRDVRNDFRKGRMRKGFSGM